MDFDLNLARASSLSSSSEWLKYVNSTFRIRGWLLGSFTETWGWLQWCSLTDPQIKRKLNVIVWLFLKRRILWLSLKPNSTYVPKPTNSEYLGTLKGVKWFTSNKHKIFELKNRTRIRIERTNSFFSEKRIRTRIRIFEKVTFALFTNWRFVQRIFQFAHRCKII